MSISKIFLILGLSILAASALATIVFAIIHIIVNI